MAYGYYGPYRGWGGGYAPGYGWGRGYGYGPGPGYGWGDPYGGPPRISPEEERQMLEDYKAYLENEIQGVTQRLKELETEGR